MNSDRALWSALDLETDIQGNFREESKYFACPPASTREAAAPSAPLPRSNVLFVRRFWYGGDLIETNTHFFCLDGSHDNVARMYMRLLSAIENADLVLVPSNRNLSARLSCPEKTNDVYMIILLI